jgi:Zn-dependent protease
MEQLLISLPVLIFSIVLHEVAHGWVAYRQGDATAAMLGRLSINPLPHIDPLGSIIIPAMMALSGSGLMLGWAKPVPVNPRNFRNYKRGDILVSLAGVTVNFLLAFVFTLLWAGTEWGFRLAPGLGRTWVIASEMAQYGVYINFGLMLFNLIPIPPLDGSHVFAYLLPPKLAFQYRQLGMRGMAVLFILLYLTHFSFLSWPLGLLVGAALRLRGLLV